MKYDFNTVCDRKNTNCMKWDAAESRFGNREVIPMWVADMDFPVAEPVLQALVQRAGHPFYGYTQPGPNLIEAIVARMKRKFNWEIQPEWIVFTPGVIPALSAAVRMLARPGDEIILQPPVYFPFFPVVTASGCQVVNNRLRLINARYEMDFADLEAQFQPPAGAHYQPCRAKGIILCNPHNPVGRVWERDELARLGEIVIGSSGVVISDEIHCEILFQGHRHTPFASISPEFAQNSIVCMAPSKTFNLAGLEASTIIIPNARLRNEFAAVREAIVPGPNVFGYTAMQAAYRDGDDWLAQVLDYLQGNLDFMLDYFTRRIPRIKVIRPQGTYLIWLDCRGLGLNDVELKNFMCAKAGVGLNDGPDFGPGGSGFQRMNIACPRSLLAQALERIERAVQGLG
jgi:cysteine-S-conjugate beta-lyase